MAWNVAGNIRGPAGAQGSTGPTGATGPQGGVGPAGLTWRGAWAAGTAYNADDAVAQNGASWFAPAAIAAGNNPNPSGDGTTAANGWALLSAHGATGATGPQGIQGVAGPTGSQGPAGATGPQGTAGATGAQGPQGTAGATGARGSQWYVGTGAPGTITGSLPGDQYLDQATGDVYTLS